MGGKTWIKKWFYPTAAMTSDDKKEFLIKEPFLIPKKDGDYFYDRKIKQKVYTQKITIMRYPKSGTKNYAKSTFLKK